MIKVEALVGLVALALWIFSLVDVIGADEGAIRHLPKLWWLLIVLFFPLAGSVAWLVVGRTEGAPAAPGHAAPGYPEYDRPGRMSATDPRDDEVFLRDVRARAEEQRARYRSQQKRQQPEPGAPGAPGAPDA